LAHFGEQTIPDPSPVALKAHALFLLFHHVLAVLGMVAIFAGVAPEEFTGRKTQSGKEGHDQKKADGA
jgi:hypothetical protein